MSFKTIKEQLKTLAQEIRSEKAKRGPDNNGYIYGLAHKSHIIRHRHIAYCLLRGTPYELIETPKEENKADQALIKKFQEEYNEIICNSEQQAA